MNIELNFANAVRTPFKEGVELYFADKGFGKVAVITEITLKSYEQDGTVIMDAKPITINRAACINLMDALWNCGIRPSQDAQTVGQLAAVQKHLEDMRQLAFKTLSVEKPDGKS